MERHLSEWIFKMEKWDRTIKFSIKGYRLGSTNATLNNGNAMHRALVCKNWEE